MFALITTIHLPDPPSEKVVCGNWKGAGTFKKTLGRLAGISPGQAMTWANLNKSHMC